MKSHQYTLKFTELTILYIVALLGNYHLKITPQFVEITPFFILILFLN